MHPDQLPENLQGKSQKLMTKFGGKVLESYIIDQISLYGEEMIFKHPDAESLKNKINLIKFVKTQQIFNSEEQLISEEDLSRWTHHIFQKEICLDNLDIMNILVQSFTFENCMDILSIFPID